MFSDPQSITVNAVAKSLPAIERNADSSTYQMDDGSYRMTITRNLGKKPGDRRRYTVRVDFSKTAADPLVSANNRIFTGSVYFVVNLPDVGYTSVEAKDVGLALTGWLTSANILKVFGGET